MICITLELDKREIKKLKHQNSLKDKDLLSKNIPQRNRNKQQIGKPHY